MRPSARLEGNGDQKKQHDPINSNKVLKTGAQRAYDEGLVFLIKVPSALSLVHAHVRAADSCADRGTAPQASINMIAWE
jgi:hypothetical protein